MDDPVPPEDHARRWNRRQISWLVAAYTCFGMGYIAYLTFISQYLTDNGIVGPVIAGFWALVGIAAAASGPLGGQSSAASAAPAGWRSSWWCLPPARCCQSCSVAR